MCSVMHHRNGHRLRRGDAEVAGISHLGIKPAVSSPAALEVDCVDENDGGQSVDSAERDDIRDLLFRFNHHPVVATAQWAR